MRSTLIILLAIAASSCQKSTDPITTDSKTTFESIPLVSPVRAGEIDEASGIADSKLNPGYLWTHEDGGRPNELSLLSHNGSLLKKMLVKSAINKDWEDIALAPGPIAGTNYIYLADIGDNNLAYPHHTIYRLPEPDKQAGEVTDADKIVFEYPDGAHDADAILVDHQSRDIYIITKTSSNSKVYRLPYPQSTTTTSKAEFSFTLPYSNVTSACLSDDGQEVLVRTYEKIYYWNKSKQPGQPLNVLMNTEPRALDHQLEPQGEAICFSNDHKGFFTLSERPEIIPLVTLNFYRKK